MKIFVKGFEVPISDWRKSSYSGDSSNCVNVAVEWRK
ncbi:DUF397 domain-containing protein, partial [Streptomyces asiaticus]